MVKSVGPFCFSKSLLLTNQISPQVHVPIGIAQGTPVTCRKNGLDGYSTHLPQNLGDGVGHGHEGHRIQPFIIFPHLLSSSSR